MAPVWLSKTVSTAIACRRRSGGSRRNDRAVVRPDHRRTVHRAGAGAPPATLAAVGPCVRSSRPAVLAPVYVAGGTVGSVRPYLRVYRQLDAGPTHPMEKVMKRYVLGFAFDPYGAV